MNGRKRNQTVTWELRGSGFCVYEFNGLIRSREKYLLVENKLVFELSEINSSKWRNFWRDNYTTRMGIKKKEAKKVI